MLKTEAYSHLLNLADKMPVIDTHEHLPVFDSYIDVRPDVLFEYLSHYLSADLHAAGLSFEEHAKISDSSLGVMERWDMLEPYLEQVRNTSYYKSLKIAMKKVHGIDDMTRETIQALQDSFAKKTSDPDYRKSVMKDMLHIEKSITCSGTDDVKNETTEFFARACYPETYICPWDAPLADNLSDYCEDFKDTYYAWKEGGMATLKIAIAYERSLYFEDVPFEEAEILFDEYIREGKGGRFPKKLQDFMFHYVLSVANDDYFRVQIHTGLQEGMFNDIEKSNPMLLKNVFRIYPNLTFDLFHIGYPYNRQILVLAKYHPNVYIDMCWAHIVSPHASREFFREALDVLPYTKIFAFGGDYKFFDGVVGHLTMAKGDICTVLAEKVAAGDYDMVFAEKILRAVFYDNAKRVFQI
ncbi:MAG: amidohydrolase family protein [Oscillospiraceae bacterium]|nr:amidohydrolase family protein [Oscillospiraceae bacterium]